MYVQEHSTSTSDSECLAAGYAMSTTDMTNTAETPGSKSHGRLHPVLIALAVIIAAALLTHIIPAGKFQRDGKHVVPGTYQVIPKETGLSALLSPTVPKADESPAHAVSVVSLFASIPSGFVAQAPLIFMLMFAGGTFGVLRATGAIDAAIDDLLHISSGNAYVLVAGATVLIACGGTFMGFSSEYVAIMPIVLSLTRRLKFPNLVAAAIVVLGADIGYIASVTNPNALAVAQPLAGVPIFSGILPRLGIFVVMLGLGLGYLMLYLRRLPKADYVPGARRLTTHQIRVLIALVVGGAALVGGTSVWSWRHAEQAAAFLALSLFIALAGGMRLSNAADALIDGMKSMVLPITMIGLGGAVGVILETSRIQDSIVQELANVIQGQPHAAVTAGLMISEMMFGILIHSVSAKAAVSIPILAPIAHLSGVSGQLTVTAMLLGSGLINVVSPTNGLLLAFLATAKVDYVAWIKFVTPLFIVLCVVGFAALYLLTALGS
ncbi:YfcC family protein [Paraburkholderia xenovorans]|uniref:SLC13 family permease n=1 Tax=Paraburkholderia xenovorans TaxID=36873 RepID=UPI0038BB87EA